jgi:hypothetical protein
MQCHRRVRAAAVCVICITRPEKARVEKEYAGFSTGKSHPKTRAISSCRSIGPK